MSVAIDTAIKLHEQQIKAVTRSQDLVVSAIEKVATVVEGLRAKSPTVPDAVAGPFEKVTAPVTKVVGTESDVRSYLTRSARDWVGVQQKFQAALLEVLASEDQAAPVAQATPAAKAGKKG